MYEHADDKLTVNNWKLVEIMLKHIIGSNWKAWRRANSITMG